MIRDREIGFREEDAIIRALHRGRPRVAPPTAPARELARARLDAAIAQRRQPATHHAIVRHGRRVFRGRPAGHAAVRERSPLSRRLNRAGVSVVAAAAALVAYLGVNVTTGFGPGNTLLGDPACAAEILRGAARAAAAQPATVAVASIRHARWLALPDVKDIHDTYQGPNGGSWQTVTYIDGTQRTVQHAPMFDIPAAELRKLSPNPVQLYRELVALAERQGYSQLDASPSDPASGIWMAALWALPDPNLAPPVRAALYNVLAELRSPALTVTNHGLRTDPLGRRANELQVQEGGGQPPELLYIDPVTGALDAYAVRSSDGSVSGQAFLSTDLVAAIPTTAVLP